MKAQLSVLLVEHRAEDAEALVRHLTRYGYDLRMCRVATQGELEAALADGPWDVVLSDFELPGLTASHALEVVRASGLDVPVLLVSSPIGERQVVEMMRAGASDYVTKDDLARLVPAIQRALREAAERRERRRAQEALRRSEAERRREAMLLNQTQVIAGVGGWEFELATGALYWTDHVYQLFGVDPATFRPTAGSFMHLVVPEDRARVAEAWARVQQTELQLDVEYRVRTGAGQVRWFRTLGRSMVEHARVTRITGANLDIDERKQVETKLLHADRLTSIGAVAAAVVHEINNPLGFIVGNLPTVQARLESEALAERERGDTAGPLSALATELGPLLGDCMVGAERIAEIARDLKVYSRLEERATTVSDVAEVLASVLRMVGAAARLRATLQVEVGVLPPVLGASSRLAQLFTNLVVNALQSLPARPAEENHLVVRARSVTSASGPVVVVEIEDNGVGIAPEVWPRLFEPFFTTKSGEGTGLGLYVCRKIVDALGGRIDVESKVGRGSTFRVTLPAAPPQRLKSSTPRDALSGEAAAPARQARILIVDDEPNLLRLVARALAHHDVRALGSGREAAEVFEAGGRFDLVLCDLMLRDLSGVELFGRMTALDPAVRPRVLFMSGGAFTPEAAEFLDALPPEQLLEKPFSPPALLAAVERLLSRPAS